MVHIESKCQKVHQSSRPLICILFSYLLLDFKISHCSILQVPLQIFTNKLLLSGPHLPQCLSAILDTK